LNAVLGTSVLLHLANEPCPITWQRVLGELGYN